VRTDPEQRGHERRAGCGLDPDAGPTLPDPRLVAHEIRQPIAVVLALAEAARVVPDLSDRVHWYLDRIIDEATVLSDTARSALMVEETPRVQRVEVVGLVEDILATFELIWSGQVSRTGIEQAFLMGDPVLVRRALVNLLDNATRAAGPQGCVRVDVRLAGPNVVISVEDDGPGFGGINSLSRLGLDSVRSVLAHLDGALSCGTSQALGGAAVRLSAPVVHEPADVTHAPRSL
jgi:K+-sensing histidine kinase KdpD